MTSGTMGSKPPDNLTPQARATPQVNKITASDITASLAAGFSDFLARPFMSGIFGLFYAAFGILLVWILIWLEKIWLIIPALVAFPLVAPFAAAGLYEMSRRMQKGEGFGWSEILTVMANQRNREMGWMAFVTLFVLWIWFYQFRTVLVVVLQNASFSNLEGFLHTIVFTSEGRCCKSMTTKDSLRESMALDAVHEQAISRPLSHDELVQLQRVAEEAGVSAHLGRQGHDLARAA